MKPQDREADPGSDSFSSYVAGRGPALLRFARLMTGDAARAEDLLQTALEQTWPRWDAILEKGPPDAYVQRVMVNTLATWRRRRAWRETPADPLPDRAHAEDAFAGVDEREGLRKVLAGLPPRQRAALVLRHWADLSVAETAAILSCSEGTVKSQTADALERVRAVLRIEDPMKGGRAT